MSDRPLTAVGLALRNDFQQWHQQMLEGLLGEALNGEAWQQDGQTLADLEQAIAELTAPEQAWLTLQANLTSDFLPTPEGQSSTAWAAGSAQPGFAQPIATGGDWLTERSSEGKPIDPATPAIDQSALPLDPDQPHLQSASAPSMGVVARSPAVFVNLKDTRSSPPRPLASGETSKQFASELAGIGEQRQAQRRLIIPLSSQQTSSGERSPVEPTMPPPQENAPLVEPGSIERVQSGEVPVPLPRSTPPVTYLPLSPPAANTATAAPATPRSPSKSLRDLANLLELAPDQDLSWDLAEDTLQHLPPDLRLNPLTDRATAAESDRPHSATQLTADFFSESLSSPDQEQPLPTLPENHDSVEEWRSDRSAEFIPVSDPSIILSTITDAVKLPAPSYGVDHIKNIIAGLPNGVPPEPQNNEMELPKITIERSMPDAPPVPEVDLEANVSALRQEIIREYHRFYGD